jgi:glutamate racemase
MTLAASGPIGVFDSGVGGLSVLRLIWQELPGVNSIYLADQGHVPYGPRPLAEVRDFAVAITRFLLAQDAVMIVVACNAASAAALHHLRQVFPHVPFVGMEPAVKPAAEYSHSRRVGVLATPATFQGELYASVVERFASGVEIMQDTCPGLVGQIEAGELHSRKVRAILEAALSPMLARGIDTVVLGCTHYPFVIPIIQEIVGPAVRVIDPAPAVARQARRLLERHSALTTPVNPSSPKNPLPESSGFQTVAVTRFLTTGDVERFGELLVSLLGVEGVIEHLDWGSQPLRLYEN